MVGRPGIEYLQHWIQTSADWRFGWAFSKLIVSSRHSCSNFLLIVLRTALNTKLELIQSRMSLPSACFWTSEAPGLVFLLSWTISFSCSEESRADGLKLQYTRNSSHCKVFHTLEFEPKYYVEYTSSDSLNQNSHWYIVSLFLTSHCIHQSLNFSDTSEVWVYWIGVFNNSMNQGLLELPQPVNSGALQYSSLEFPSFLPEIVSECVCVSTWSH